MNTAELSSMSKQVRWDIINMTANAGSGHPGGSLSAADLMTCLFFNHMHVDPKHPDDPDRDRFVLSKGHAAPCYYAVLAEMGFISRDEFKNFRQLHSILQGHPDSKKVPGVDAATGSLGQGCSIAVGMALGAKVQHKDCKVYTLLGDGECQEGQIWESFMAAAHYHLDNLTIIIDNNGLQIDGTTETVMNSAPLEDKLRAFNFNVVTINGHDFDQIESAVQAFHAETEKPTCIILDTVKGTGVSYMTNSVAWHGKGPNDEEYQVAMNELNAAYAALEQEEN
jgi:transketolase